MRNFGRHGPGSQQGAQKGIKRVQNTLMTSPSDKIKEEGMRRVKRALVSFAAEVQQQVSGSARKRLKSSNIDFNALRGPTETPRVGMTSNFSERNISAMPLMEKTVKMRRNEDQVNFNRPTKARKAFEVIIRSPIPTNPVNMDTNVMQFPSPVKIGTSLATTMAPKLVLTSSDRTNWRKKKQALPVRQFTFDECNGQGENDKSEVLGELFNIDLLRDKSEVLGELYKIVHVAANFNGAHGIGDKEKRIVAEMFEATKERPYYICSEHWTNIQKDDRIPVLKLADLLRKCKSLGIDASGLIASVLTEKKAPVDTHALDVWLAQKIRADMKGESKELLTQASRRNHRRGLRSIGEVIFKSDSSHNEKARTANGFINMIVHRATPEFLELVMRRAVASAGSGSVVTKPHIVHALFDLTYVHELEALNGIYIESKEHVHFDWLVYEETKNIKSAAALKNVDVPKDHENDLQKAYSILAAMANLLTSDE